MVECPYVELHCLLALAGVADLGADVVGQGRRRIARFGDAVELAEPETEDVFQHRPVECLLGAEVVMHVGLGQACLGGDGRRGRAAVALGGEDLLGGAQDQGAVADPDMPGRGLVLARR